MGEEGRRGIGGMGGREEGEGERAGGEFLRRLFQTTWNAFFLDHKIRGEVQVLNYEPIKSYCQTHLEAVYGDLCTRPKFLHIYLDVTGS